MCVGGGKPKAPDVQAAPPPPPPPPVITPSEVSAATDAESRKKRTDDLRYGLASTIKTSPRGITGAGADLTAAAGAGAGGKTKLGV